MQIDIKHIKKQFEKSMPKYDKYAIVQHTMAEKLIKDLSEISTNFENILELGCGTGFLTKKAIETLKFKTYTANDLSEKSKKYLPQQVNFIYGNALKLNLQKSFDLILSNAVFQWFENMEKALPVLTKNLEKKGILAFSTFLPENFCEISEITGLKLNYIEKEELLRIIEQSGFKVLNYYSDVEKIEFATPLDLLAHIKNTGVNSLQQNKWGIKEIKEFCEKYNEKFEKVTLTYAPIIFICEKL